MDNRRSVAARNAAVILRKVRGMKRGERRLYYDSLRYGFGVGGFIREAVNASYDLAAQKAVESKPED